MFLKRRLAASAAVLAAVAVAAPAASASAPVLRDPHPSLGSPRCPDGYSGPTNLATGCPWWMISDVWGTTNEFVTLR
jgi:hypothetical protein